MTYQDKAVSVYTSNQKKRITALISDYWQNESGATAIEYGLIAALIGTAIVAGITSVGSSTESMYETITTTITTATNK